MYRLAALSVALLLALGPLAGCLGAKDEAPTKKTVKPRPASPVATTPPAKDPDEVNTTLGKRWHFHNYWGLSPNLTLFDGEVGLDPTKAPDIRLSPAPSVVLGRVTFGLPQGRIVPPETGTITAIVHYNATPAAGAPETIGGLNLSYKPANVAEFIPAGTLTPGGPLTFPVTADMTDVPHRGRSIWEFSLAAAPSVQAVAVANMTVHVQLVATIGRPIFIDPPHLDHWKGAETLPLISSEKALHGARSPLTQAPYVRLVPDPTAPAAEPSERLAAFPVVNGSVVPESSKTVLVRLTWAATAPVAGTPGIEYLEENAGTTSVVTPVSDKVGERLYKIDVIPRMTDSPYANQSTWRFNVLLEGEAGAWSGTIKLEAWATKLSRDAAAFPGAAGGANATLPLPVPAPSPLRAALPLAR